MMATTNTNECPHGVILGPQFCVPCLRAWGDESELAHEKTKKKLRVAVGTLRSLEAVNVSGILRTIED